ncbi:MAG: MarR family transcriptional regulator [Methylophaga sp.]|nr:MarR family transcriptional regulator [Methylophaga sp.]
MSEFNNLKLDNQLCFALYGATNAITRLYRELLKDYDLTYPQYLVLLVLWQQDGVPVKTLSERLKLDTGTLSPLIKRLEKNGFIVRKRSEVDERMVHVHLTQHAKAIEPAVANIQNQVACHTNLNNHDFFELLNRLNKLAEDLVDRDRLKVAS